MISLKVTFNSNEVLDIDVDVLCSINCYLDSDMNTANINLNNMSNGEHSLKPIAVQIYDKNITKIELYRNSTMVDSLEGSSKVGIAWSLNISETDDFQETLSFTKKLIH